MARKIKLATLAVGTDGDDFLHGSNKFDTPDVLDGGAGNDTLKSYIGADTLTGGSGSDTFIFDWYDSGIGYNGYSIGIDTITDFESIDKIDLSHVSHYSEADLAVAVSRPVDWSDVTVTANNIHVEVVAGDPRWDIDISYLGVAPVESNFVFA